MDGRTALIAVSCLQFFQDLSREGHVRVRTSISEESYDAVTICPRGSLSSD